MEIGKLRKEVLSNCPEDFEDELREFIDDIEDRVNEIRVQMDIHSIDDIGQLNDAYELAGDLATGLY